MEELKKEIAGSMKILKEQINAEFKNLHAINANSRLSRVHQPIHPINALHNDEWSVSPEMPKTVNELYLLGQQGQGIFETSWHIKSDDDSI